MEPLFDKLVRQMPREKRYMTWMLWTVGISFLWFFIDAYCTLRTDDGHAKAHPFLYAASRFMDFPLGYIPAVETSVAGGIANCMLWGLFLVWLCRLTLTRFLRRKSL
jgi:hypothetical protein